MIKTIFSLLVIVMSGTFAFYYVEPAYSRMQERRIDLETLNETFKNAEIIKDLIKKTGESLRSVSKIDSDRFDIFLPETIDIIRFSNNIQHLARTNGIVLDNIETDAEQKGTTTSRDMSAVILLARGTEALGRISPTQDIVAGVVEQNVGNEKKYVATEIRFSFTSTYQSMQLFLNNLEDSLAIININELSFSPVAVLPGDTEDVSSTELLYEYTVEAETYSLK